MPTSEVMALAIGRSVQPGLGVTLAASMPDVGTEWGYVTGFELTLRRRRFGYRGRRRSLLSASCPAPPGFTRAPFRLAQGTFYLADGSLRRRSLGASCRVRGG